MKTLRNKKTGEISTNPVISVAPYTDGVRGCHIKTYRSIDELLEEWEDYEPKEPRIEDKKMRKAVRAWAKLNAIKRVVYVEYESSDGSYCCLANMDDGRISIKFAGCISALKDCEEYFIDELCGGGE